MGGLFLQIVLISVSPVKNMWRGGGGGGGGEEEYGGRGEFV